jgi:endothelin-converting enzyme/putative endopeptidase
LKWSDLVEDLNGFASVQRATRPLAKPVQIVGGLGLAAMAPELRRIEGIASKAELATAVARLHLASATSLAGNDGGTPAAMFGFGPAQDYADSTLVVAAIDQGGLALPGRDYRRG